MSKYEPLADYLRSHVGEACSLTFTEIERIIGCSLPASARQYPAWWGNDGTHAQARAWMRAGFGAKPSPQRIEPVVFKPVSSQLAAPTASVPGPTQVVVRKLEQDVVAALKRRARRAGRSLEGELRAILARAAHSNRDELIAEANRIRAMTSAPLPDSTELIREDRMRR